MNGWGEQTRIPSLVFLCQRVAGNHTDQIISLGDLRYELVKPILERCSVDQLLQLEEGSPHLQSWTPDIWKSLCFQKYRLIAEEHYSVDDEPQEPDSWKRRYFACVDAEAKRFEEIGLKIRFQRLEAEERKKEREVKITDGLPPPKRMRSGGGWGVPTQPKTLLQKARGEASKIQKAFYNSRTLPPMPTGKTHRIPAKPDDSILPYLPTSMPSRVTVTTVQRRIRPPKQSSCTRASTSSTPSGPSSSSQVSIPSRPPSAPLIPNTSMHPLAQPHPTTDGSSVTQDGNTKVPPRPPAPSSKVVPPTRPVKSPGPLKKDPMASLFVPKHRAYSQRPVR